MENFESLLIRKWHSQKVAFVSFMSSMLWSVEVISGPNLKIDWRTSAKDSFEPMLWVVNA
jgi:hypothetical protein